MQTARVSAERLILLLIKHKAITLCVSITVLMFTLKSPCRKNLRYLDISPSRLSVSLSSCSTGLEEEKALREAAGSDRWDAVDHRVPEGGVGERQHQHRSAQEHGLRFRGAEGRTPTHVSTGQKTQSIVGLY